jgi:hypothetical protein
MTATMPARTADARVAGDADGRVRLLPAACIALRLDETNCMTCRDVSPVDCIEVAAGTFRARNAASAARVASPPARSTH